MPLFRDLPPETIGRIASFSSIQNSDLLNFAIVAGRSSSRSIKHSYLKDNIDYLTHVGSADGHTARWRQNDFDPTIAQYRLQQWCEINEGWETAHKPYQTALSNVQSDVVLLPIDSDKDEEELKNELINGAGFVTFETLPQKFFRDLKGKKMCVNYPFDVVIAVDGVDVSTKSFEDVCKLLFDKENRSKPKKLQVLHSVFWCLFLNPAIACDLGSYNILRNIVENVGVDVNCQTRGIQFGNHSMALLARALVHPDKRMFDYLLSRDGINCNPQVTQTVLIPLFGHMYLSLNRSNSLLHTLTRDTINDAFEDDKELDVLRIKQLIDKNKSIVNDQDRNGRTPLYQLVHTTTRKGDDISYSRNDLLLAKVFLDAGSTVEGLSLDELPNRRGFRGKMAALCEAKGQSERDAIIASLRPLKRKRD